MTFSDLKLRIRAIVAPRQVERELDDELSFHLECETRKLIAGGMGPDDARRRALARFGPVPLAADQCRDERGISLFDTVGCDVRFALRSLRRTPLVPLTIVPTIALGLGVIAVAFTFFNSIFFRVDAVRNPDELFEVVRPERPGANSEVPFRRAEYEAFRRETDVFTGVAAMHPAVPTRIDGRATRGTFVSGNFFDVLGVTALEGRTLTQADNNSGGRPVIVLSYIGWEKLFAKDPSAIGREILLNGQPYIVAGVMPKDFRGLRQEPQDYWAPLALVDHFRADRAPDQVYLDVIGRLQPGTSPPVAAARLSAWASVQSTIRKPDDGIVHMRLRASNGVLMKDRGEAMVVFMPVFFAFGLILMIGSANVANLLLARGLSRHREIGVRLSLGATRGRIVRQLLTENLLLALAAAGLGLLVSRILLAGSVHMAFSMLPPEFAESMDVAVPPVDWRVLVFLFAGAFVSTVMFGLVPALQSTRIELVRAMRGEVTKDARPSRVRHFLIGSQVTASALLLVCAAVFLRSTYAAATAEVGVRTDDSLVVAGITEPARPAVIRAVQSHPSVTAVAASWPQPTGGGASAEATVGDTTLTVGTKLVSSEYFDLLGINVLRGRLFAPEERSPAAGVVVVSDAVARRFWPNGEALGQMIRLDRPSGWATEAKGAPRVPSQLFTVIGVVRDVRSALTMFNFSYSGVYLPVGPDQPGTSLLLRVHGDPEEARRTLLDALTKIDPALADITTMRMMALLETSVLGLAFWMAVILGGLALALTISGLFSVLSYLIEQRKREIGVRMALGATPRDVITLVVAQLASPVGMGVVAGGGLAAVVAIALLATPLAEMMDKRVNAFDPVAYVASITVILVTCLLAAFVPARRAAHINPMTTLKTD